MRITVHRGIDQIGGCITEISTEKSKVLIDLGHNLPQGDKPVEDKMDNPETIAALCEDCDAVFYTHYHGDHFGLLTESDRRILFFMTRGTYEMLCVNDIMRRKNLI